MAAPHVRARRGSATGRPAGRAAGPVAVLGALGVLGVLLAGCSGGTRAADEAADVAASGSARSAVATGADCLAPQVLDALGFDAAEYTGSRHPDAPDAGVVPDGFTAVSAVTCSTGETLTDAAGRWAAVTASRLEGDVRPLLSALGTPATLPATGTAPTACAPTAPRTALWLVDAVGAAVRVALPADGCGRLPTALADGIAALDAVDVEHYPVALVEPRPGPSDGTASDGSAGG
ncbi:hypothetical protein [Cellulomonas sp. NPDC058312]|uniref:hypothetical protein n=1 Tax=Cellulomonas sp. NPDC058312 TaxID=3346441 RepID=UPI0036E07076